MKGKGDMLLKRSKACRKRQENNVYKYKEKDANKQKHKMHNNYKKNFHQETNKKMQNSKYAAGDFKEFKVGHRKIK